jgi:hypothetical protein
MGSKRSLPACCIVLCLAGVALAIAGGVFLGKYDPLARAKQIAAYNAASDAWTPAFFGFNSESENFQNLGSFTVTALAPNSGPTISLNVSTANIDQIAVEVGPDIEQDFTHVAYTSTESPFSNALNWPNENTAVVYASVTLRHVASGIASQVDIPVAKYREFARSKSKSGSYTACSKGTAYSSMCRLFFRIGAGGVCFVVDPDTKQFTRFCSIADESASEALVYSNDVTSDGFTPRLQSVAWGYYSSWPGPTVPWTNFPITVRSSKDPWVVAAVQTEGTMQFGGKDDALKNKGTILLGVGLGLLGVPILMILAILLCAFRDSLCGPKVPFGPRPTFGASIRRRTTLSMDVFDKNTIGPIRTATQKWRHQNTVPTQAEAEMVNRPPPRSHGDAPHIAYESGVPVSPHQLSVHEDPTAYPTASEPMASPYPNPLAPPQLVPSYGASYGAPYAAPNNVAYGAPFSPAPFGNAPPHNQTTSAPPPAFSPHAVAL